MVIVKETIEREYCDFCNDQGIKSQGFTYNCIGCGKAVCKKHGRELPTRVLMRTFGPWVCEQCDTSEKLQDIVDISLKIRGLKEEYRDFHKRFQDRQKGLESEMDILVDELEKSNDKGQNKA